MQANPQVVEGAEEFSLGSGPTGILLIHGFTGSPQGMRGLGDYLAERGLAVEGIRLPGHGTTWEDLNTRTGPEWDEAVEAGFAKISESRDEVFVVALSFGAALAVELVSRHPQEIAGLVTLAGFVHTDDPRRFLAPIIRRLLKSLPGVGNDIADPDGREIAYDRLPTGAAHHMLKAVNRARAGLSRIACPVLVMHGRNDHTVKPHNAELIYNSVASTDKELVWCERSYHVITLDYDRDEVFERTYKFIAGHTKHAV